MEAYQGIELPSREAVGGLIAGERPQLKAAAIRMYQMMRERGLIEGRVEIDTLFVESVPGVTTQ